MKIILTTIFFYIQNIMCNICFDIESILPYNYGVLKTFQKF